MSGRVIFTFRHDGRKWRWWLESDGSVCGDGFDTAKDARDDATRLPGKVEFWEVT